MEACGLKYQEMHNVSKGRKVTPYGGVWIEIFKCASRITGNGRHALWRRVD